MNEQLLNRIQELNRTTFSDGTVVNEVLDELIVCAARTALQHTVETGCGRTTLLLSHLSGDHLVFSLHGNNIDGVREHGDLLRKETTRFIEGPSLQHLPTFHFEHPLDLAFLDGAHGFPFPFVEYYFIYPHLREGAILVVDDLRIPTVYQLFDILRHDAMYELEKVVSGNTAFFRRTDAPTANPFRECWQQQGYNTAYYPVELNAVASGIVRTSPAPKVKP